jgi:hypothetical protein
MPGSLSGTTVTVTPASTTTYTVTGSNGPGCQNTATVTVTVNPNPTVTVTASSGTICSGSSSTLTGNGASTYTWMPGSLSGTSVSVTPVSSTTYTVTGTSAAGCTNTATQLITVNPSPTVTVSATSNTICAGASTSMTGSGATSYSWMPGSLSGTTVTVTPASTTTYTVTGTNAAGCTNTATQTITVNPAPVVTASSSSNTVCAGTTISLTGNGALNYNWMPGNLSGSPVNDNPNSSTTYTVTGTDVNGCSNTATVAVTVNALPSVIASSSSSSVCPGGSVTLTGNGATTYNWMPGNISGSPVSDTPASSTTYTMTGTDANGCSNTDSITVIVNPLPNITISGNTSICAGDQVVLTGNGGVSYSWQPGGQTTSSITDSPAATTTYTLTGTDANGCTNTATQTVMVGTPPAQPTIIVNGSLLTSSVTGATYQWYLNGNPIAGATSQSYFVTTVVKGGGGVYTVVVCDAAGCCSPASSGVTNPTGIDNSDVNVNVISVLPNPNNGEFTLTFHINSKDDYILEIHDVLGQVIYSENLDDFSGDYSKMFNLTTYGRGMYTITLRNGDKQTVIKAITY